MLQYVSFRWLCFRTKTCTHLWRDEIYVRSHIFKPGSVDFVSGRRRVRTFGMMKYLSDHIFKPGEKDDLWERVAIPTFIHQVRRYIWFLAQGSVVSLDECCLTLHCVGVARFVNNAIALDLDNDLLSPLLEITGRCSGYFGQLSPFTHCGRARNVAGAIDLYGFECVLSHWMRGREWGDRFTNYVLSHWMQDVEWDDWFIWISGIEFKDLNLGFHQCTFLCITLKCIEIFHKIGDYYQIHSLDLNVSFHTGCGVEGGDRIIWIWTGPLTILTIKNFKEVWLCPV